MSVLSDRIRDTVFMRIAALKPGMCIDPGDVLCSWGIGDIQEIRPDLRIHWDREAHAFRVTATEGKN